MRTFIESLQRLYKVEKIDKEKLDALVASNKITKEEYYYILGKEE